MTGHHISKCKKLDKLTIWVPDLCNEFHFRRPEGIIFWESEMSLKNTTFTGRKKNKFLPVSSRVSKDNYQTNMKPCASADTRNELN